LGACEQCRGFGRTIGIDYRLVIPDEGKTLAEGAIKPWQTKSNQECQDDLLSFARQRDVPTDVPWRELTPEQRAWVIDGEGSWRSATWAWATSRSVAIRARCRAARCSGSISRPRSAPRS